MDFIIHYQGKTIWMGKVKGKRMDHKTKVNGSLLWKNSFTIKIETMETSLLARISNSITKTSKTSSWYLSLNQEEIDRMATNKVTINPNKNYLGWALLANCNYTRQQKTVVNLVYISLSEITCNSTSKHRLLGTYKLEIWRMETHVFSLVFEVIET
jgi:hypothetical protein